MVIKRKNNVFLQFGFAYLPTLQIIKLISHISLSSSGQIYTKFNATAISVKHNN